MHKYMIVSRYEFLQILRSIDGDKATFITLLAVTKQDLRKTGNPYRDQQIYKISKVLGLINFNYSNMVHKKDESYQVGERPWGKKSNDQFNGTLVDHKEWDYLSIAVQQELYEPKYSDGSKLVDKNIIAPFIPIKKSYVQDELGITYRTYRWDSIRKVRLNGIVYKIVN